MRVLPIAAAAVLLLTEGVDAQGFADHVVFYQIGAEGGAGLERMPGIVLGPPHGRGAFQGSTDTLSLGLGGWIILQFTNGMILDGPGQDFTVFENPFLPTGLATLPPFAEPGTVSVSADGVDWRTFPCQEHAAPYYPGCAGVYPVFANADDPAAPSPFVPCSVPIQQLVGVPVASFVPPACSGGDSFDLAAVGLAAARFVRIDASQIAPGLDGTAGFDLDAVAAIHFTASPASPATTTTLPTAGTTTTTVSTARCPAVGTAGVLCVLRSELPPMECDGAHLPRVVRRQLEGASALAAVARTVRNGRKAMRLARLLGKRLRAITRRLRKSDDKRRLPPACVTALERVLGEAADKL